MVTYWYLAGVVQIEAKAVDSEPAMLGGGLGGGLVSGREPCCRKTCYQVVDVGISGHLAVRGVGYGLVGLARSGVAEIR